MTECFLVFAEPGDVFQGVHRTIDGAAHNAAGLGASAMPDGSQMTVDAIRQVLHSNPIISFACCPDDIFSAVRIERHAILL